MILLELFLGGKTRIKKYLILVLISTFLCTLYIYHLDYNFYDYDESVNLYASWELSQGKFPYHDFFFVYLPSIHFVVGYIFNKFGVSIFWARFLSILFAFLTAYWVFYFSFRVTGKFYPALFSCFIFLLNPYTLIFARTFKLIFFWLFFSLSAFYFVNKFLLTEKKRFIFLAGICMGISVYIKLLAISFFMVIILILLLRHKFRASFYFLFGFFLTFVFPVIYLVIKFYPQMWDMTIKFHFVQKSRYLFATLKIFIKHNFYLFILGIPFFLGYKKNRKPVKDLLFASILTSSVVPLISRKFIWVQYFYPLIPLFSIVCSHAVVKGRKLTFFSILLWIMVILCCGYYVKKNFKYIRGWKKYDIATVDLAKFINNSTNPGEYILSECLYLNILAGRENPPQLADISHTRIVSQGITPEEVIEICEKYKVKLIIYPLRPVPFRLDLIISQPAFKKYLTRKYRLLGDIRRNYDVLRVFVRKGTS